MAKSNTFIAPVATESDVAPAYDFASLATRLFGAFDDTQREIEEIERQYTDTLTSRKSRLLSDIRDVAEDAIGMTGAEFDAGLKAPLTVAFTEAQYKAIPTRVAMLKVAFLAFANGIEPSSEKAERNLQHFVNEEARPQLLASGVLESTGKGRKAKSTAAQPKDALLEAAIVLARHGDASLDGDVVKERAAKLRAFCTAGNWKMLDKLLDQGIKTLKLKV